MATMGKGYGSECHLLRYLGRHRHKLDDAIRSQVKVDAGLPDFNIDWLDFSFDKTKAWSDAELKGLDFLPSDHPVLLLWRHFWPQSGNTLNWDAIGNIRLDRTDGVGGTEWMLLEAKAHLEELKYDCGAKGTSRHTIQKAMDRTKTDLGVPAQADWLNPYYQFCNRVAVLHFLNTNGVAARLVFIYFCGDAFHRRVCPKNEPEWRQPGLAALHQHVALPAQHSLSNRIHEVFLPVV